jgi:hypothetical protein
MTRAGGIRTTSQTDSGFLRLMESWGATCFSQTMIRSVRTLQGTFLVSKAGPVFSDRSNASLVYGPQFVVCGKKAGRCPADRTADFDGINSQSSMLCAPIGSTGFCSLFWHYVVMDESAMVA